MLRIRFDECGDLLKEYDELNDVLRVWWTRCFFENVMFFLRMWQICKKNKMMNVVIFWGCDECGEVWRMWLMRWWKERNCCVWIFRWLDAALPKGVVWLTVQNIYQYTAHFLLIIPWEGCWVQKRLFWSNAFLLQFFVIILFFWADLSLIFFWKLKINFIFNIKSSWYGWKLS